MLATTYTADDRERFADPHAAARVRERAEHLREDIARMEAAMGRAISEGQRAMEGAMYGHVRFAGGYAAAITEFRAAITEAFSGPLKSMLASLEDDR